MKPNVGFLPHGLKLIAGAACKLGLSPYLITGLSSAASQIYTDYPCVHWDPGGWLWPQGALFTDNASAGFKKTSRGVEPHQPFLLLITFNQCMVIWSLIGTK